MKDRLLQALQKNTADYAEIRVTAEDATTIAYRGKEIEQVSTSRLSGGIVRACVRGGWATVCFDSLDGLPDLVADACRAAALVGKEKTELAAVSPAQAEVSAKLEQDFRGVSLDDKLKLVAAYNAILLNAGPQISSTSVRYTESFRTVHFASTRGACFMEERPKVDLSLGATARDGALVQSAHDGFSSATTYGVVAGREQDAEKIAKRALALLKAPKIEGGVSTVLLDQRLAGVFAHEAFGHLSEADFLYENPRMRDLMHLGRPMGVKQLQIVDDGSLGRLIGTHPFDDEGTPTGKHYLIRDGVLVGHLHQLETAAKMGEAPTGNARTVSRHHPPIVRMTNTYIEAGTETFEQLIKGIDRGLYACDCMGGMTMMEQFTFSAAYAHRIENGRVGELVRDVVLTGNVFETLHRIDGFGNDLKIIEGSGGCGKGWQAPLPVTFGAPHLRIQGVVIGGK